MRRLLALCLLAAAAVSAQQVNSIPTALPGNTAPRAVPIQGVTGGTPIPISGSISVSGTADVVSAGAPTTFSANSVCTGQLLLAGEQGAGFQLNAGTLAATLTPQYSMEASGSNWTNTQFIDQNGSKTSSLVVTNPNSLFQQGVVAVTGARRVQVCTTAYTSGSATGLATAAFVQGGSASGGGGGSVNVAQVNGVTTQTGAGTAGTGTQRVATATSDGNVLSTANTGRLQVDVVTGGGSNASIGTTGAAVPGSATYMGANKAGNLVAPTLDTSGNLNVNVAAGGSSTGDVVGPTATFNGNGVCATVLMSGRSGAAFQIVGGGNLSATFTPSASTDATPSGNGCTSGTWKAISFDTDEQLTIAPTSTTAGSAGRVVLVPGGAASCVRVCTTSFTSGSSNGFLTATVQPANFVFGKVIAVADATGTSLAQDISVAGILINPGSLTSLNSGPMVQGAVTTAAPSYTNNQVDPLSLQTDGSLRVAMTNTPTVTANIGTSGSLALDATLTGGTQKAIVRGGAKGATAAADVTSTANGTDHQALDVNVNNTPTVTANAGSGTMAVSSTQLPAALDGSGFLKTHEQGTATVSGTVTANVGTTNGLALDATVAKLNNAQGSTTSGETGPLVQGAVTTAAPTYTTAQTSPISLQTDGSQRVAVTNTPTVTANAGSGTFTVGGTVTANAGSGTFNIQANASTNLAQINGTTILTGNGTTGAGSPRVTIASDNTPFAVNAAQSGSWTVDVSDRAARLLGVVYGSQGQQLKQTATNFNLQVEEFVGGSAIDARQIRLLTSSDVVDVSDRSARLLGKVTGSDGNILSTANTGRLQVDVVTGGGSNASVGTTNTTAPTSATQVGGIDSFNMLQRIKAEQDGTVDVRITNTNLKLQIAPKVQVSNLFIKPPNTPPTYTDPAVVVTQSPIPVPLCPLQAAISQTASTAVIAGKTGKVTYVCKVFIVSTTAQSVSITEGTGAACASGSPLALAGSTTVANGMALAANGGWVEGTGAAIAYTAQRPGDDVCLLQSGAGNVAGSFSYVQF